MIIAVMFAKFVGGVIFHGLVRTYSELRAIRAEESSEKMFPEHANTTNRMA